MKQKASKVLLWTMIAIAVAWVIFILSCFTTDGIFEFWTWGLLAIITAPAILAVIVILGYIRSTLNGSKERDPVMYRFSMSMTIAFAVLTLAVVAVRLFLDGNDVSYPWSYLSLSSSMEKMGLAFGTITLFSFVIGILSQLVIKRFTRVNESQKADIVRTTGICLTVVICLAVLFVPQPMGSYNDGGSQQYESVLYQVINWNRTQEFDGTPFHEDDQNMRVYFFPFNCYEYDAKWKMNH